MASMNPLKALIIDDERLARADLKSLLSRHAQIEVVGEADDVSSAARRVEEWFNYSFRVYLTGVEEPFIMSRRQATKLKGRMG